MEKIKFVIEEIEVKKDFTGKMMPVETNIVLFRTESATKAESILQLLKEQDILAAATGGGWIRFVTHLDISEEMMNRLSKVLKASLA